ncbi:hypothetical protein NECID01_1336 [Nematocida sp. AWRm77]|nr:hypothetical protein NECID01_1336 [Nematocida sp. AWRm77]
MKTQERNKNQEAVMPETFPEEKNMPKSASTLHCCEIPGTSEKETQKEEKNTEDKEYSLCFTSEFWRSHMLISKEEMNINFSLLGPLVCSLPLIARTDIYYSRSVFSLLILYITIGALFIKNTFNWWVCTRAVKRAVPSKVVVFHSVLVSVFFLGVSVLAYHVALGDHLVSAMEAQKSMRLRLEEKECALVPGVTDSLHSYSSVLCTYLFVLPCIVVIAFSEIFQNKRKEGFCLHNCRLKIACILVCIGLSLAELKIKEKLLAPLTRAGSVLGSVKVFLLVCGFYCPFLVLKEIEGHAMKHLSSTLDMPSSKRFLWECAKNGMTVLTACSIVVIAASTGRRFLGI